MSLCYNSLYASDVTTVPIKLRYSSSFSAPLSSSGIHVLKAISGSISPSNLDSENLRFASIKHLYYSRFYSGSFMSSSLYDNFMQSTAASGTLDSDNRQLLTTAGDYTTILSIPREKFGENISRYSFVASSSIGYLVDDGNGNIIDISSNTTLLNFSKNTYFSDPKTYYALIPTYQITGSRAGNILYSQGMVIITNSSYEDFAEISNLHSLNFAAETTIYENTVRCRVSENDFNYTLNPSANKQGSTGSYIDVITGSEFRPYATTIGLYNQQNELLLVGKLAKPCPIPTNTDLTFVIRWDS